MRRDSSLFSILWLVPVLACQSAWGAPAKGLTSVNRTVPKVEAAPLWPVFSEHPTENEIIHARVFPEPLIPFDGWATANENQDLVGTLQTFARQAPTAFTC